MSSVAVEGEVRRRLSEILRLWTYLDRTFPDTLVPVPADAKSLRGLWIVSVYGVVEHAVNRCVQEILSAMVHSAPPQNRLIPTMQAVALYPKLKSSRNCSEARLLEVASEIFEVSMSASPVQVNENPFAEKLQNVDGATIEYLCKILKIEHGHSNVTANAILNSLRERRNAVSHGRETAEQVGSSFTSADLRRLYDTVDSELLRFVAACSQYVTNSRFASA